jgi:hypothetical protein
LQVSAAVCVALGRSIAATGAIGTARACLLAGPEQQVQEKTYKVTEMSMNTRQIGATSALAARGSLTRADLLLCVLPIALFLSIVSLV